MAPRKAGYRRIPDGHLLAQNRSIYAGPDHLLMVARDGSTEQYRRYYYRDIQGILIHQTRMRILYIVLALGAMLFMIPLWLAFPLLALLLVLLIIAWNIYLGPTCDCYLQTATFVQRLWTVNRVRRASRVVQRLGDLVGPAQADLAQAAEVRRQELLAVPPAPAPGAASPALLPADQQVGAAQAPTAEA
jgi:hypothetical protein